MVMAGKQTATDQEPYIAPHPKRHYRQAKRDLLTPNVIPGK
jgi:hypothetical protein